jgi:uncharacterized protein (DUF488 family)
VAELLSTRAVGTVIDVRSHPSSRFRPEYNRGPLAEALERLGLRYRFEGDALGGRPSDPECYGPDGDVRYAVCRERPAFTTAVWRLAAEARRGSRLALLCAEARPEGCHRTRLVAEALAGLAVSVLHVDEHGAIVTHASVIARTTNPQLSLLEHPPAR